MIILLDIGNSRIKWGWLDGQDLHVGAPLPTAGDFEPALTAAWDGLAAPSRVLVSNVAGAALGQGLDRWLADRFGIRAEFVTSRSQGFGVSNGYKQPQCLGCDRWLVLVALRQGWPGAACVLDAGTAATFDLLDGDGRHRGGAIAPGLNLMAQTLLSHTVGIASAEAVAADWLGADTDAAIACGGLNALAGMAERLRRQACELLGQDVAGILTGGDALLLAAHLRADWQLVPDLLLQGLAFIAREEA